MQTIIFVLENGKEIVLKCKKFTYSVEGGLLTAFNVEGAVENIILCLDFSKVVAVYRVLSDESEVDDND